jgi:hypothetical protein
VSARVESTPIRLKDEDKIIVITGEDDNDSEERELKKIAKKRKITLDVEGVEDSDDNEGIKSEKNSDNK